jgi:hypothetical protein
MVSHFFCVRGTDIMVRVEFRDDCHQSIPIISRVAVGEETAGLTVENCLGITQLLSHSILKGVVIDTTRRLTRHRDIESILRSVAVIENLVDSLRACRLAVSFSFGNIEL